MRKEALFFICLAASTPLCAGEFRDPSQSAGITEEAEQEARAGKSYYYYPGNCVSLRLRREPVRWGGEEYMSDTPFRITILGTEDSYVAGLPTGTRDLYRVVMADGTEGYIPVSLFNASLADSPLAPHACVATYSPDEMAAAKKKAAAAAARRPGVSVGMTAKEVRASSWGAPRTINRTTTAAGVAEQWVYGDGNYLYLRNGRVTAIQN